MITDAIKAIVKLAKDCGKYDRLVVKSDYNEFFYIKNDTQTCYFDDANEILVCLRTNANPIRHTLGQDKYEIICCTYDHIGSMYFQFSQKELKDIASNVDFEDEDIARVIRAAAGDSMATTWLRNKNGKFNTPENGIAHVTLGVVPKAPDIEPAGNIEKPEAIKIDEETDSTDTDNESTPDENPEP